MIRRFIEYINQQHLFLQRQKVLLAVSGGRDSVVMADMMKKAGYIFAIAHCNFHLREGECDRDQAFTRTLAKRMGVEFFATDFDTNTYAKQKHLSIEQAARELRYEFFATICRERGYSCLATAHHADDSIETFFLNLLRGTGIGGLHGILPSTSMVFEGYQMKVVRPLLPFFRTEIDDYVAENRLSFVEDSTNASLEMQRNRLRHRLIPLLRELSASFDSTMLANIGRLADTEMVFRQRVEALADEVVNHRTTRMGLWYDVIALDDIRKMQPRETLLYELLRPYGFNAAVVVDILSSMDGQSGAIFKSATHFATIDRGSLMMASNSPLEEPTIVIEELPTGTRIDALEDLKKRDVAYLDADTFAMPIRLRRWAEGDRFMPFGMARERLVSDYLKDEKVNRIEKRDIYLLVDAEDRPLWVVGYRVDNRHGVEEKTRKIIKVSLLNH